MAERLNATFFTLRKRDRAVLLPATLVMAALVALIAAAFLAINWGFFSQLLEMIRQGRTEPLSDAESVFFVSGVFMLFGSTILLLFPFYLVLAAYEAACLRWMIRGETPGLFGLTIDNDTWRVYGVYWCWVLLQYAIGMVAGVVMVPLMFMTMGAIIADPTPDPMEMLRWQLSVQLPLTLLQYVPLAFFGVRFAPAAATSVARRRFSFFDAWTVTKGRFWELFGSFAVLWLIAGAAFIVVLGTFYGVLFGQLIAALFADWPNAHAEGVEAAMERLFSPAVIPFVIAGYAAYFAICIGYMLMSYGVNARAALAALEDGRISPAPAD